MSFTYVSSYYDQPHLAELWWNNLLETWNPGLAAEIDFVFVDDGSPKSPLVIPEEIRTLFKVRHFRIDVDIPWNEMGARNLGMKHVNGWALLMDADFVLTSDMANKLLEKQKSFNKNDIYLPIGRIWKQTKKWAEPINLFMMHADAYWKTGGYPEQYAGHYGCSDMEFLRSHSRHVGKQHRMQDISIDHFPNGHVTWISRDLTHNSQLISQRIKIMNQLGPLVLQRSNLICNFPWHEITSA